MRCTSAEKLLPLYVEGDLHEREAGEVGAHLSSCEGCRQLAEELRLSQGRIHNFAAPEFDEEFYRGIRRAVLAEINSGARRRRPSFLNIFAAPFGFRPALAASLLLLIFFAGIAGLLYKRPSTGGDATRMVALEKSFGEINANVYDEAFGRATSGALKGVPGRESAPQSGPASMNVAQQVISPRKQTGQALTQRVARQSSGGASTVAAAQARDENEKRGAAPATEAVARMEIQTSDPNIRIIWLARKSSE